MLFRDRSDAGRHLAAALCNFSSEDLLVLGLPRGGVPVAYEVSHALAAPLDFFLVRKLGVPGQRELAMGAIASGGVRVVNEEVIRQLEIPSAVLDAVAAEEWQELRRREQLYRANRQLPRIKSRTVILIDDGLATGSTMRAASRALRKLNPHRIIVAVPVASAESCEALSQEVDDIICLRTPEPFRAVGYWYEDFSETSDDEVRELLQRAAAAVEQPQPVHHWE